MPFCASCGSQVEGSFCAKCGSKVGGGAVPASGPAMAATTSVMADNVASALCYVLGFITGIIFLVLAPYNRNPLVRFHAFQSIFLSVAWIAFRMVGGILLGMMGLFTGLFFLYRCSRWSASFYGSI